jgi:hypothetical protein
MESAAAMPDLSGLVAQVEDGVRAGKTAGQVREQLGPYLPVQLLYEAVPQYEEKVGRIRSLREPRSLVGRNLKSWYPGPSDNDTFCPALRTHLLEEKGWSDEGVQSIDEASSKVVSCPQPPRWAKSTFALTAAPILSGSLARAREAGGPEGSRPWVLVRSEPCHYTCVRLSYIFQRR